MPTIRIEKTKDYTVMANHHLRNKALSLKAKGLLSYMLSLPEDWNYTLSGLATSCKDGLDSVRQAVSELETYGYVVRSRIRDARGRLRDTEYVVYESPVPVKPALDEPIEENPAQEEPVLENPTLESPALGDPTLLNTNRPTIQKPKTQIQNTHEPINATRLFSLLYGQTLNVGRVMSPTLALVMQREAAIDAFIPETFYTVQLSCGMTAVSERIKEKKDAERLAACCHLGEAVVESVERKEKTENPPKLYDLTSLQRDANRLFGYTAQQTLDYTQSLYEKKLCTYPRTDSRYLTEDMAGTLPSLVRMVATKLPFTAGMQLTVHPEQVIDNKKVSDHHAILPTGAMIQQELQALPIGEQSILQLLSVRLLCAVGDAHKYQECRVIVRCSDQPFTARGRTITQMGWKIPELTFRGAMGLGVGEQGEKEVTIPKLTKGQILSPVMADIKEGITSPPKHFTEDTLLSAMENAGADEAPEDAERKGLGTPATRAGILEKLVKSGFLIRKGDRKTQHLIPTDKAKALIAVLPESIRSASMTAEWEHRLLEIERGHADGEEFIGDIQDMVRDLIRTTSPAADATDLFRSDRESVGICPRCGAPVTESPKGFFCENRACRFGIWKDNRFFTDKGQKVTAQIIAPLLKEGSVRLTNLKSPKTGKTYDATVFLDASGEDTPRFRLEFDRKERK